MDYIPDLSGVFQLRNGIQQSHGHRITAKRQTTMHDDFADRSSESFVNVVVRGKYNWENAQQFCF